MKFDLKVWLGYRREAKTIADYINIHKIELYDKEGNIKRYKFKLSKENLQENIDKITAILKACSDYLDLCGIKMPKPLYEYDPDNTSTWKSHDDFAFNNLIK